MADVRRRHPKDQGGSWFVDTTCIDCDVARQLAPGLIEEDEEGLSYFVREPKTTEEVQNAWRALLACPSGSIGAPRGQPAPRPVFPFPVTGPIQLAGYHSSDSFGAHSYFVADPGGNFLVDSPRFVPPLVEAFERQGGLQHILLTHRDDVADAASYAKRFDARIWIHDADADAAPDATDVFSDETLVRDDLVAIPFPGHTRGSALYLWRNRYLFTGDSLAWSRRRNDLTAFRDATWYSWTVLTESMGTLLERQFEWVLPGHGSWGHDEPQAMRQRVARLVQQMQQHQPRPTW